MISTLENGERCRMEKKEIKMYKLVPKHTIKRMENAAENEDFHMMKLILELAKESDDKLWRELILLHLDDMKIWNRKDRERIKKKFEGNL